MHARRTPLAAVVTLVGLAWPATGHAQDALPARPVAVVPSASPDTSIGRPTPPPGGPAPSPLRYAPPPPPPPVAPPPSNSPFLDPGPGGWGPAAGPCAPPGLFFGAETVLAFPAVKFRVGGNPPPSGVAFDVPTVDLPVTVSPLFELGYRLPHGAGLFAVNYRFLVSEETDQRVLDGVPANVRTRLNINVVDLDYGVEPVEFAPRWTYSWRIGARIADVFFDNRVEVPGLTQTASNKFFGAGPHARVDVERRIVAVPGLALLGGLDGAVLIGQVKQRFSEQATSPLAVFPPILLPPFSVEARRSQAVPYLNVRLGLSYVPPSLPNVKLSAGYQFEEFFNVGKLGMDGGGTLSESRGEVWAHGLFLRGQVDF
jgi:hypothetical protein